MIRYDTSHISGLRCLSCGQPEMEVTDVLPFNEIVVRCPNCGHYERVVKERLDAWVCDYLHRMEIEDRKTRRIPVAPAPSIHDLTKCSCGNIHIVGKVCEACGGRNLASWADELDYFLSECLDNGYEVTFATISNGWCRVNAIGAGADEIFGSLVRCDIAKQIFHEVKERYINRIKGTAA